MATELEHIELANRNHDALRALLHAADEHPEWVATIAFYKALQILEATFAARGLGHSHGHAKRLEIIQDVTNGYANLCKHYEALMEASEVARYLGARTGAGSGYSRFSDYMSMSDVRDKLIKKRLLNVEMHARQFLTDDAKKLLTPCKDLV